MLTLKHDAITQGGQDYKEERYKGYAVSKMNLCEDGHEKRHEEDSVSKINLNEHVRDEEDSVQFEKPPSPQPSYVSLKSDISMVEPCTFHDKTSASFLGQQSQREHSSVTSCVSLKSNNSMVEPCTFSDKKVTSILSEERADLDQSKCGVCKQVLRDPVSITCEHSLCRQRISGYYKANLSEDLVCPQCRKICGTHPVLYTNKVLQQVSYQIVDDKMLSLKEAYKTNMKNKYESLFEGINLQENQTLLNSIYTQLYILERQWEGVNAEHEVLQMEKTPRGQPLQDTPIHCNDIFEPLPEPECKERRRESKHKIKSVLTKGIAGIGKTVSVQKFILDWAENKVNQDVDFMFVLPFRELNLIKDHQYSLHKLLLDFHPELQGLDSKEYDMCKVVLIFDGLDESKMQLKFSDIEKVSDVTETSSVAVLIQFLQNEKADVPANNFGSQNVPVTVRICD